MLKTLMATLILLTGCDHEPTPSWYVQGLKPDMYFVIQLTRQARTVNVSWTSTKPTGDTLPVEARVITWANDGGNLYDETLGDATLTPVDTGDFYTFSGSVVHPLFDVDQVGIEMRSFLNYVGFRAPPLAGGYCDVEFSGRGITECGPWFHALLQLWAQCRGVVGQLVPCSGQTFVIVPQFGYRGSVRYHGPWPTATRPCTHSRTPQNYISTPIPTGGATSPCTRSATAP